MTYLEIYDELLSYENIQYIPLDDAIAILEKLEKKYNTKIYFKDYGGEGICFVNPKSKFEVGYSILNEHKSKKFNDLLKALDFYYKHQESDKALWTAEPPYDLLIAHTKKEV